MGVPSPDLSARLPLISFLRYQNSLFPVFLLIVLLPPNSLLYRAEVYFLKNLFTLFPYSKTFGGFS